jgi:hypothetical protein
LNPRPLHCECTAPAVLTRHSSKNFLVDSLSSPHVPSPSRSIKTLKDTGLSCCGAQTVPACRWTRSPSSMRALLLTTPQYLEGVGRYGSLVLTNEGQCWRCQQRLNTDPLSPGGSANQEMADSLHMSPATAETHVSRILMKLDARDRAQLVVIALETGFISPG